MTESENPIGAGDVSSSGAGKPRRRSAPRRKASPRPRASGRTTRRKAPPRARTARRADLQGLLRTFAKKAGGAGARLAEASGQGARATRRAWTRVSGASRKTIDKLTKEWKQMDAARKAQFIAALLGALAAASAPIVRRGLKKK